MPTFFWNWNGMFKHDVSKLLKSSKFSTHFMNETSAKDTLENLWTLQIKKSIKSKFYLH
jgi:hypothetical protein